MCGETLGDLEPVYDPFPMTSEFALPEAVTQKFFRRLGGTGPVEKVVIFTVNHRGTLTSWGGRILILSKTGFRSPKADTKTCGLLV